MKYPNVKTLPLMKRLLGDWHGQYSCLTLKEGDFYTVATLIEIDGKSYFVKFGAPDYNRVPTLMRIGFGVVGLLLWSLLSVSMYRGYL